MTRRPWLRLTALWLTLGVVMAAWVGLDRRPPEWDHANHLGRALHCQQILARPDHALGEILDLSAFYPPLAICAAGLAYVVFPVTASERKDKLRAQITAAARRLSTLIAEDGAPVPKQLAIRVEEVVGDLLETLEN